MTSKYGIVSHGNGEALYPDFRLTAPRPLSFAAISKVVFGAPGAHCTGQGICRFEDLHYNSGLYKPSGCQSGTAVLHYGGGAVLKLHFLCSSLSECAKNRYFRDGFFQLPEPVGYRVGTTGASLTLQGGTYRIVPEAAVYSIQVNVRVRMDGLHSRHPAGNSI
ncbi:MAG: hypothetical protein NXI25_04030 [bacterium]|nr:hypothetical protein [bacterium]